MLKHIFSFLLILISLNLFTQERFIHYTNSDGLPQMQCVNLFQDHNGYIWIGTKLGLSRFDGINFKNYGLEDGLSSASIAGIIEDNNKELYFLTTSSICKLKNDKIIEYKLPDTLRFSFNSQKRFFVDNQNNIIIVAENSKNVANNYIICFKDGIFTNIGYSFPSKKRFHIRSISYNKNKSLNSFSVFNNNDETFKYDIKDKKIIKKTLYKKNYRTNLNSSFEFYYYLINDSIKYTNIFEKNNNEYIFVKKTNFSIIDIVKLKDSSYVILGFYILEAYDKNWNLKFQQKFETRNWNMIIDKQENIWIANENGLYKSSIFTNYNTKNSNIISYIWGINEDNNKNMYFASYGNGLCKLDTNNIFKTVNTKINNESIINFYYSSPKLQNGNMTFISGQGIFVLDDKFHKLLNLKQVMASCADTVNNTIIFASKRNGIYEYNDKTNELRKTSDTQNILSMQINSKHELWYSNRNGLGFISKTDTQFISIKNKKLKGPFSFVFDKYDNIWIGCTNGLYFYDHKNFYRINHSELNTLIFSVAKINDNEIIYGGKTGIGILNLSKFYKYYHIEKKFLVFVKNISAEKFVDYFSESQGFMGTEIGQNGIFKDSRNRIWIPTNTNVVMFDPNDIKQNTSLPFTHITNTQISEDYINWTKLNDSILFLNHNYKHIKFEFIGINLSAPELVKYKYRLIGLNNNWSNSSKNNNISFSNLKPGKYKFQVLSCNASGNWNTKPIERSFVIIPAWYQTLVFKIALPLIFLIVFFLIIKYTISKRHKASQKEKDRDSEIQKLRLAKIRSQIYPHFFFNSLSAIMSLIYRENKETGYEFFLKLSDQVRESIKDSNRTYKSLEDELKFVDNYLAIQKFRFKNKFDYKIGISDDVNLFFQIPPVLVQTFAENAVSHGIETYKKDGQINIIVSNYYNNISIIIDDNGIGRKKAKENEYKSTGIGIKNLDDSIKMFNQEKKEQISYKIVDKYEDEKAKGTRIEIFIHNSLSVN